MALTSNFKFRLPRSLERRANRVLKLRMQSRSEFGRRAFLEFIEREEKELGLPPLNGANGVKPHSNGKAVAA